jgi:hypothetical protein
MGRFGEDDLHQVIARYEATKDAALAERDASLRAFHGAGWRAVELQRVTGYSRETIRQALSPQARSDINAGRRLTRSARAPEGARRFLVPDSLAELVGPTTGTVTLPDHLVCVGADGQAEDSTYDLANRGQLTRLYTIVMHEATSEADLRAWLNQDLLVKVWPELVLAGRLRLRWERRFPALGRRSTYRE